MDGDFRYVTPGAYRQFAVQYEKSNGAAAHTADEARRELLKPGSEVAKQLALNSTVLQVGDTLFAHAGILPEHVAFGFDNLNERVSGWMEGRYPKPPRQVVEDSGVVWNRLFGAGPEKMYGAGGACPTLLKVLEVRACLLSLSLSLPRCAPLLRSGAPRLHPQRRKLHTVSRGWWLTPRGSGVRRAPTPRGW